MILLVNVNITCYFVRKKCGIGLKGLCHIFLMRRGAQGNIPAYAGCAPRSGQKVKNDLLSDYIQGRTRKYYP